MPILENLAEGFAKAADAPEAVAGIEQNKKRRQALSDRELEFNTQNILNDVTALQTRRMKLDPKSPTYQQDIGQIDQALHSARQTFTDLYHPQNNPDALSKLGGFIKSHLGGKKQEPQPPVTTPAQARDRLASIESVAYAPQAQPDAFAQANDAFKRATGRDMTPDEKEQWAYHNAGLPQTKEAPTKYQGQLTETTDADGKKHYWRVPQEPGGKPEEVDFQGQAVTPKGGGAKPVRAWRKDKNGKLTSVLLDPKTNQPIPGSENSDIMPPASMTGRISTGFYHFVDDKGQVHQVQETRTSMPAGQGGAAPNLPRNPKEAKDRIAKPPRSNDNVIGQKETPVQAKAHNAYVAAETLSKKADAVAQNPDDAVNQKRLAVALERQAAGRFTTQALDYIIKAGWGNTIEQWANNPSTGALPKDVMRQLIEGAHQEKDSTYAAWQETLGKSGAEGTGGGSSKKKVSLKKAMALPQNQGKTEAQVRTDIESHNYEVAP